MNHLGVQISALVDGELTGAELDRANAHLAACEQCRAEAAELRQLKRDLRALAIPLSDLVSEGDGGLAETGADEALTRRLLAMAGPGGPVPSRRLRREQHRRDRSRNKRSRSGPAPPARGRGAGGAGGPGGARGAGSTRVSGRQRAVGPPYSVRPRRFGGAPRRRGRYMLWSALSVVVVGIGAAAFGMGGGGAAEPAPQITPQLEMFSIEHAINSGEMPFPDPAKASPGATRP